MRNRERNRKSKYIVTAVVSFLVVGCVLFSAYTIITGLFLNARLQDIAQNAAESVNQSAQELVSGLADDMAANPGVLTEISIDPPVDGLIAATESEGREEEAGDGTFWTQSGQQDVTESEWDTDETQSSPDPELYVTAGLSADVAAVATDQEIKTRIDAGLTKENLEMLATEHYGKYWYMNMPESSRTLYLELYYILSAMESDIILSATDTDALSLAFNCVMSDHPEIFYVKAYTSKLTKVNGFPRKMSFSGVYSRSKAEVGLITEQLEQTIAGIIAGVSQNAGQYEKAKYVYEYIALNTDYVIGADDDQNIVSVLLNGASVCAGYARTAQLLLERLNVPVTLVLGVAGVPGTSQRVDHAWNLVNIDGYYYYFDCTWGDASYSLDGAGGNISYTPDSVNYDYLNITTAELSHTHSISDFVPMPRCVAKEANYYVREGAFFEFFDDATIAERIALIYHNRTLQGHSSFSIKCADADVYRSVYDSLVMDSGIFEIISLNITELKYTQNDAQFTLTFFL